MCIMYGKKVAYLEIPCSFQEIMGTHYQQVFYGHKQLLYFQYSFCYSFLSMEHLQRFIVILSVWVPKFPQYTLGEMQGQEFSQLSCTVKLAHLKVICNVLRLIIFLF